MCPIGVGTSSATHILETGKAKLWVCLVGVNQYHDDCLYPLRYSAIDCQELGEALAKATQQFPRKEITIHHDFSAQSPMLKTVHASLQRIVLKTQSQDTILFYFSGHGVLDPNTQQAVLCLADTQKDNLLATGMGLQELLQMLETSSADHQLICLDICHSGDITLEGARDTIENQQGNSTSPLLNPMPQLLQVLRERAVKSKGFCALLSCGQGQQSWEFPELGHGVFTYYLIRGLLGEAADSQGVIEADGLYKYVYRRTLKYIKKVNQQLRLINQQKLDQGETQLHPEYPLQTPKQIVEGVGELILGLRTASTGDSQPLRQALVVDGLSGGKTLDALSQVLGGAGSFKLEYWPQTGKAWSEVRGAIQECLCWHINSKQESLTSFLASTDAGTALLYLRGQIEEIEDVEAWLVLEEKICLSRSWLRNELRRSNIAQQIVVLDCPRARSLASWVEDLQLDPERGQCIIAAAAPPEDPEIFSQVLLETLKTAKPQVGLSVMSWISQMQTILATKGIQLHVWLSEKGVIQILTKDVNSDLQDLEQLKLCSPIAPPPLEAEPRPSLVLSAEQHFQLESLLMRLVGPIAPTLLRKVSGPALSSNELVKNLSTHLHPYQRLEFEEAALSLLQTSIQPKTILDSSLGLNQAIDASFIHQCEQELADLVGPIASFVIRRTLKSNPQISSTEFVEILAAQILDPQKALEFQQRIGL